MTFTGPKKLLEKWANDKTFKTGRAFLNSAPNKANISFRISQYQIILNKKCHPLGMRKYYIFV